jgi:ribosomal protein L37AE/L43A
MSNSYGASRQFNRNYEVCRFIFTKQLREINPELIHWRDWTANGRQAYRQYYKRTSNGIHLFDWEANTRQQRNGYTITFNTVQLTYGVRYQFDCPKCSNAARILYLKAGIFACRNCHHITYESTHGSDLDRLATKVSKMRIKTFGKTLIDTFKPDVFESSDWLPKPKYAHNNLFENRLKELTFYEHKLQNELRRREWSLFL